jgi:hypothetical protein
MPFIIGVIAIADPFAFASAGSVRTAALKDRVGVRLIAATIFRNLSFCESNRQCD